VIEYLLEHRGWIVSRESLLQDIWQDHAHVEERTIDVHVAKARELVGKERIVTMPGMGYGWKE
jgi:DNA-binding response OmpR family regulator